MLLKKTFILFFIFCSSILQAQNNPDIKRTMHWYFGYGAGLDFSSGTAVADTNGKLNTYESSAIMSDTSGNLLFYSDGDTVWNRLHQPMANGTGLLGSGNVLGSSTQGVLIIPKPLSNENYYIFTVDCAENSGASGLRYSIVDMSLNSGFGDITLKNVLLYTPTTEKLTATFHCNKKDIWIVSHKLYSNCFYSYLVTENGVDTVPVISIIGIDFNGWIGLQSQIKFSPDSRKLLNINCTTDPYYYASIELYDFDNSTGVISNRMQLSDDIYLYGGSWSPDGNKFYVATEEDYFNKIYQYDISSNDSATIISTKTIIAYLDSIAYCYGIQTAPDGKLYISRWSETNNDSLAIIQNPNASGVSCNFVFNGISLQNRIIIWGLPNFFDSYFYSNTIQDTCDTLSILEETFIDKTIKIYPNPANDYIVIDNMPENNSYNIKVYNLFGELVLASKTNNSTKKQIDVSSFSLGIYLIQIYNNNNLIINSKLIKI